MDKVIIDKMYELYMKNNSSNYLNKHLDNTNKLDLSKNIKNWKWQNKDVPRVFSILDLNDYVKKYNITSKKMIIFSDYEPETEYIPHDEIFEYSFEKDNVNYDLHKLNVPKLDYDFALLCQTLEHLYNPLLSLQNIYKYLTDKAYIFCNVPTVNIQHMLPYNFYTGFTPVGLGVLFQQAGFQVLEIGHWGNSDYITKIFTKHQWPDFNSVNNKNEFKNPCQSWVLAQK